MPHEGEAFAGPYNLLETAQMLRRSNRDDEAYEALRQASVFPETRAVALTMIGFGKQAAGHFKEAKTAFEGAICADPCLGEAYLGWTQSGRATQVDSWILESALRSESGIDPKSQGRMAINFAIAKLYADLEERELAMRYYDHANRIAKLANLGGKKFDAKAYEAYNRRLQAVLTADVLRRRATLPDIAPTPVVVVGMMRSGTTLVEQILSNHSSIEAAGEVDFWVLRGAHAIDWSSGSVNDKFLTKFGQQYARSLTKAAVAAPYITDKMPQNTQWLGLIALAAPNAKLIHVRRDPLDTCFSIYTTPYEESPEFAHSQESIVAAYREYRRMMEHWRQSLPDSRLLEIEYEELVQTPEPCVRAMLDHCGLPWEANCLKPESNHGLIRTPSVWQARQAINKGSVGRARVYLPWLRELASLTDG